MLIALAHCAICVPDLDAATQWYSEVLGLPVLVDPYRSEGETLEQVMGPLLPSPVVLRVANIGFTQDDRIIELIEYPEFGPSAPEARVAELGQQGLEHIGLVCDDIVATRSELEARGVEFVVPDIATMVGVRTTWFIDPWKTVLFILLEKSNQSRPFWRQDD